MEFYVRTLQINIEQAVFTIALTQLFQNFGPIIGDQIKKQCTMFSIQAVDMVQQIRGAQSEKLPLQDDSLPSIIFIGSKPYIALNDFHFASSWSSGDGFAGCLTLTGKMTEF